MINKTGKLRGLVRDLESKFDDAAATQSLPKTLLINTLLFIQLDLAQRHALNIRMVQSRCSAMVGPNTIPIKRPRCVASLKTQIQRVDEAFDKCNTVYCRGEAEGFFTEKFLDLSTDDFYLWFDWSWTGIRTSENLCVSFRLQIMTKHVGAALLPPLFKLFCDPSRFHNEAEAEMKSATYVSCPRPPRRATNVSICQPTSPSNVPTRSSAVPRCSAANGVEVKIRWDQGVSGTSGHVENI